MAKTFEVQLLQRVMIEAVSKCGVAQNRIPYLHLFARGVFQALKSRALQRATDPQVNAKASQSPLGKGSQGRTSIVILWTQKFYVGNNCCVSMYQYVRM